MMSAATVDYFELLGLPHRFALDPAELERRKADWKLPAPRYTSGVLAKYARLASGAERGAITEA